MWSMKRCTFKHRQLFFGKQKASRKSEKAGETSDGDLICLVLSLEDVVTHFTTSILWPGGNTLVTAWANVVGVKYLKFLC